MNRLPIETEEMARRLDRDFIASLKMISEGGSSFELLKKDKENDEAQVEERELPETYQ